jgi:hypothetical protein
MSSRRRISAGTLQSSARAFIIRPEKNWSEKSKDLEALRIFPRGIEESKQYVGYQPAVDVRICSAAAQTPQSLHKMLIDNYR